MAYFASTFLWIYAITSLRSQVNAGSSKQIHEPLTLAAFNAQNLGNTKFGKPEVMDIIIKIILRYDCICIQEVVTQDEDQLEQLLNQVNDRSDRQYFMTVSERLGRDTTAKEQYMYLCREDRVRLLNAEVYPDPDAKFTRPPYIVHMEASTKDVRSFVSFCVHTKPDNAATEISALADVFDYTRSVYKTEDTIIMGDFNAACGSVRVNDWPNIILWNRADFSWLLNDSVDTSAYRSGCANDRIVIAGSNMKSDYISKSARAFDFQDAYSLTEKETHAVSDHYPVEFALKGNISQSITENIETDICIIGTDKRRSTDPQLLYDKRNELPEFEVMLYKDYNGKNIRVEATIQNSDIQDVFSSLDDMYRKVPGLLSNEAVETVKYKAKFGSLNDSGAHSDNFSDFYYLTVDCNVPTSNCHVQICKNTYYN